MGACLTPSAARSVAVILAACQICNSGVSKIIAANYKYLMDGITFLPEVKNLVMSLSPGAHAFGASMFHLLRLCAGTQRLKLQLVRREEPLECPSACTCDKQNGWKSEDILLNLLGEAEIHGIKGVRHEVVFLKQLFRWARR